MTGFKHVFSLVVDPNMPEGTIAFGQLRPKVLLTVMEGRSATQMVADDWPEGMSPDQPIATLESVYGGDTVYIIGKPIERMVIEAVVRKVDV